MYYAYIVRCADGSYYSGYAASLEKRIAVHNSGKGGAKYTRSRLPVELKYSEAFDEKGAAMRREAQFKRMCHAEKAKLAGDAANKNE